MAKIESDKKTGDKTTIRKGSKTKAESEVSSGPKIVESDLYSKIVTYEESLSKERNAEEDAAEYIETCKEISKLLENIADIKVHSSVGAADNIKELQSKVTGKIMLLKRLNRLEKMRMRESRETLQKFREQVDSDNLHLQNLVYENLHLTKEVAKCYDFKSIDEDMDLIPVEEFYATAPKNITAEEKTKNNPHELKLMRLTWELTQRKELAAKLKQLQVTKETLTKDIESKKEQLYSILPYLKTAIEATKPLQNLLDIPVDKNKKLNELALLLPRPLFILFVQAQAFSSLIKWLNVTILGKPDEEKIQEHHYDTISSDSDSDNDEGDSLRRRKKNQDKRKSGVKSGANATEAVKEEILKKHPLSVKLTIAIQSGVSINIVFQWLTTLEIVCVLGSVNGAETSAVAASDLLTSPNILSSIFPGDVGSKCPNPSAVYHLKRAGLNNVPSDIPGLGVPFEWAQTLCGLTFLPCVSASDSICQQSLENTLRVIKKRINSRIKLAKEISLLESGEALRDKKVQGTVTSFSAVTSNDFQATSRGLQLINDKVVDSSYLFYEAAIDVSGTKLAVSVALPVTYPTNKPIFVIELLLKNQRIGSLDNDHIRDVEREVNVRESEEEQDMLLLSLMERLLFCLQVLGATEFKTEGKVKATFFSPVSGRKRSHPYQYLDSANGVFIHR